MVYPEPHMQYLVVSNGLFAIEITKGIKRIELTELSAFENPLQGACLIRTIPF